MIEINIDEIKNNPFFWYNYICWFRGFDDENEINIDEALEILEIDQAEFQLWGKEFFPENSSEEPMRFISGKMKEEISFHIDFAEYEIAYFINDIYIGQLSGHFEAWFLTWDELMSLSQQDCLFLLLLPMTGIDETQIPETLKIVSEHLKNISKFEKDADYIAKCIVNGLLMEGIFFQQNPIGIVNNQNHSVRNIEKYPMYKEDVIQLNADLKKLTQIQ